MNRLSSEKSPYLIMHADNPVDWYAWGDEAFKVARAENKPIFLSIGYSSCHWCHVIARESFEDARVAQALNSGFVSVKVDREERPDIDNVYMDAVELFTGAGGWPMTLLLTPDAQPFFAATYIDKPGLLKLLNRAQTLWRTERESFISSADEITRRMRKLCERKIVERAPDSALFEGALRDYKAQYDPEWGGFGRAPKFPAAHNILFLLAHYARTGDKTALDMAEGTLTNMARGGIYDQIGGGFFRYSVDGKWLVPHFEKMLYDNALIIWAYAQAWSATKNPAYMLIARRTADYVEREMTGAEGEFYCAQDADSEGKEGAYYVFDQSELERLLGEADARRFCEYYGITREGNFESKSIPNLIGGAVGAQDAYMDELRERVYEYRKRRLPLRRDDKVLTAWNALMIIALCAAGDALGAPEYTCAARRAEAFLRKRLMKPDGKLFLSYREGEAKGAGVLMDYAYYALALVTLNASVGFGEYLRVAESLADIMLADFSGGAGGGFYLYDARGEALITRPRETWDGAMPSGNSCAALTLKRLADTTSSPKWRAAADAQLKFIAGAAAEHTTGHGFALFALTEAFGQCK